MTDVSGTSPRRLRCVARCAAGLAAVAALAVSASPARAYRYLPSGNPVAPCPPIPDASDVAMSPEEWAVVDSGEVLIRIVTHPDGHKVAQAIAYLDANPLWLFDRATDSVRAPEVVDEVREVVVLEKRPSGKLFRSTIEVAFFLPKFHYTISSSYLDPPTGQCWSQVEGDFERNEGTHSFLWDPVRKQTLAVFTFVFELRGLLGLLPEKTLLKRAGSSLEVFMRRIEALVPRAMQEDPIHTAQMEAAWADLRPRLEQGAYPGRLWLGYPPPAAPTEVEIRELDGSVEAPTEHREVVAEGPSGTAPDAAAAR